MLVVNNLTVRYGSLTIVNDVSFKLGEKEWLMIVGPNGAGKSTIVSAISQGVGYSGQIICDGADVSKCKPSFLAKKFGVLTQNHNVGYSFSVGEIVRMGRYAYSAGMFSGASDEDDEKVENALKLTDTAGFREQSVLTLSGGELQRAFLAQLFAQDPELLILDEPTNHLDLVFQKQIFALIRAWISDTGRSVISVVHDLSLAKAYGTHAMLLDRGRLTAWGEVNSVLTRENLESVYSMDVYTWMREMLSQWS